MTKVRIAEIRAANHQGDVSHDDIEWLCAEVEKWHRSANEAHDSASHWLNKSVFGSSDVADRRMECYRATFGYDVCPEAK